MTTRKIIIAFTAFLFGALLNNSLAALEQTKQTVVFGFLVNGSPVSRRDNEVVGFCEEVFTFLKTKYVVKTKELEVGQRFENFASLKIPEASKDAVRVQCGPDSKTEKRANAIKSVNGIFSRTFAKTSIKLLIRNAALDDAVHHVERLRIGVGSNVLQDKSLMVEGVPASNDERINTATTIKNAFPTATIVPLFGNRAEALERLRDRPYTDAEAIDAYASDEIILNYMQVTDFKKVKGNYSLYPVVGGYSHEEYALSVYNDNAGGNQDSVLSALNNWLANDPTAKSAEQALQPSYDGFTSALEWLNREDHLNLVRWIFRIGVGIVLVLFGLLAWRRYFPLLKSLNDNGSEPVNTHQGDPHKDVKLTNMELKVLRLKLQGFSAKEIARHLDPPRSERTVEKHIGHVIIKLKTTNAAEQKAWLEKYDSDHPSSNDHSS